MSVRGHALMVARRLVTDPDALAARVCGALDKCDADERRAMAQTMRPVKGRASGYPFLRREITDEEVAKIDALNEPALRIDNAIHRYYPNGETAAHVLGFVNIDNEGQTGIELAQQKKIAGKPGKQIVQVMGGARRTRLSSRVLEQPTTGATVELTIDKQLQFMVERELQAAVTVASRRRRHRHRDGPLQRRHPRDGECADVQSERRGGVGGGIASEPRGAADLRARLDVQAGHRVRRRSAERHTPFTRMYDCGNGQIRFGNQVVRDVHSYAALSFQDVFMKSSNVGAIRIGLELGPEVISRYVSRFGFGEKNARDIPHQRVGLVDRNMASFKDRALASVSMGYQIGVTPLQMVAAYGSIANGGELIAPRLVRAIVNDGKRIELPEDGHPPHGVAGRGRAGDVHSRTRRLEGRHREGGDDRRLLDRRQDRHGAEDHQRPLLAQRSRRLVRRLRAVAQSARRHPRGDRQRARRDGLRRRRRRAALQDRGRSDAPSHRRGAQREPRSARAGRVERRAAAGRTARRVSAPPA